MNCPYCNKDMILGNIFGDGRMNLEWVEDIVLKDYAKRIILNKEGKSPFKKTKAQGWYCKDCNKIIIDTN